MAEKDVNTFIKETNEAIQEVKDGLNSKLDEKQMQEVKDKLQTVEQNVTELSKVDDKGIKEYVKNLQEQNDTLENKVKQLEDNGGYQPKSQGKMIHESLKKELEKGRENFLNKLRTEDGMEIKASEVNFSNSFTESYYEAIPQAQRLPGIQQAPRPQPTVWNLMNPGVTSRRYIPYVERTGYTSGASMVDDTTAGGQADISFEDKQATVKKISVKLYASRDSIEDVDYLQSEIQRLLNHDIVQKRENQILTGTGTGNDLHGLIYNSNPIAKAFAQPTGFKDLGDPDESSALHAAMTQVMLGIDNNFETGYMANGIVVHPTQIANMMNAQGSDGHYKRHPLLSPDGTQFNGATIVPSKFIDNDTFLVGDFSQARPFVRRNISLRILDQNASYGEEDVLTFVLTYRVAFFVPSPHDYAFAYSTFDSAIAELQEATA